MLGYGTHGGTRLYFRALAVWNEEDQAWYKHDAYADDDGDERLDTVVAWCEIPHTRLN